MTDDPRQARVDAVREAFQRFEHDPDGAIASLGAMYAPHVMFRDPIQTLHGVDAVIAMNRKLVARFPGVAVELGEATASDEAVHLAWTMTLTPRIGPPLRIEGMTRLVYEEGLVVEHRDYWDLLGAFMDTVPLAGSVYRMLVARLG